MKHIPKLLYDAETMRTLKGFVCKFTKGDSVRLIDVLVWAIVASQLSGILMAKIGFDKIKNGKLPLDASKMASIASNLSMDLSKADVQFVPKCDE